MSDDGFLTLFRCEHWACSLSHRACLRRQTETKWIATKREARPIYERCGSGECQQGNEVAAQHPGFVPERKHIKKAPRLDIVQAVEEGRVMPMGYRRGQACKTCGSTGTLHKGGCAESKDVVVRSERLGRLKAAGTKPAGSETKAAKGEARVVSVRELRGMTVAELLDLKAQVLAELEGREEELATQLAAIRSGRKVEAAA